MSRPSRCARSSSQQGGAPQPWPAPAASARPLWLPPPAAAHPPIVPPPVSLPPQQSMYGNTVQKSVASFKVKRPIGKAAVARLTTPGHLAATFARK